MDTVRMGVIGAGNMGSNHVVWISKGEVPGMVLTAVADISADRREWALKTAPGIQVFDNAIDMMKSGLVDAVIVATPHYDHPVLVKAALENNLHVMCEKPAGVFTKAVREVNAVAEKSDKTYAIMFNQRTNCIYRKMKELIASGELGQVRRANWLITDWFRTQAYYDSGSWRATWAGEGGGVLLNQCPHNLDLFQWLVGMPKSVTAFVHNGKWHDIEVEDDVTAYMELENGATAVFITTTGDYPGTNRLEVVLDGGTLICEKGKLFMKKLAMGITEYSSTTDEGFGHIAFEEVEVETDGENPQHQGVLRAFANHLLKGEPLVAEGVEGINGLTLSNAMHLSSWTGAPVTLPLDEDKFLEELNKRRATSKHKDVVTRVLDTTGTY